MHPDLVFVGSGVLGGLAASYLALTSCPGGRRQRILPACLWALLAAGLLVQGFAPHLHVEHNAFEIAPELLSKRKSVSPSEILERARRQQMLSAFLTIGASVGLALHYRRLLVRPNWRADAALSAREH